MLPERPFYITHSLLVGIGVGIQDYIGRHIHQHLFILVAIVMMALAPVDSFGHPYKAIGLNNDFAVQVDKKSGPLTVLRNTRRGIEISDVLPPHLAAVGKRVGRTESTF